MRKILTAVVVALAALIAADKAEGCDACRAAPKQKKYEGKLVKEFTEDCPAEDGSVYARLPRLRPVWVLKTADKTYSLKLGTRGLTRLAAALEGQDVVVTGTLDGDTIDVRDVTAKETSFVGDLVWVVPENGPGVWTLKTNGRKYRLIFAQKAQAAQAKDLVSERVRVTGRLTAEGFAVTSIVAVR